MNTNGHNDKRSGNGIRARRRLRRGTSPEPLNPSILRPLEVCVDPQETELESDLGPPIPRFLNRSRTETVGWITQPVFDLDVEGLAKLLEAKGHEGEAAFLRIQVDAARKASTLFRERVAFSHIKLQKRNEETRKRNAELEPLISDAESELMKAEEVALKAKLTAADACATAELPGDTSDVSKALADQCPHVEALMGSNGLPRAEGKRLSPAQEFFVVTGLGTMLMFSGLGPRLDVLWPSDLENLDLTFPKVIFAIIFGHLLVCLWGAFVTQISSLFARTAFARPPGEHPKSVGGRIGVAVLLFSAAAILGFLVCEPSIGATGILESSLQRVMEVWRASGRQVPIDEVHVLPQWTAWTIAVLITCPYSLYKFLLTWNDVSATSNSDWVSHLRMTWIEARRKDKRVVAAEQAVTRWIVFDRLANAIREELDDLHAQVGRIEDEFDSLTNLRIDNSWIAACGEAFRLFREMERLVSRIDRLGEQTVTERLIDSLSSRSAVKRV